MSEIERAVEQGMEVYGRMLDLEGAHIEDAVRTGMLAAAGQGYEAGMQEGLDLRDQLRELVAEAVEALDDVREIIESNLFDETRLDRIVIRLGTAPTGTGGQ